MPQGPSLGEGRAQVDLGLGFGVAGVFLAFTPLLPVGAALAAAGLVLALRSPPARRRRWAVAGCGVALAASALLLPLFLMFLDGAGLLRP